MNKVLILTLMMLSFISKDGKPQGKNTTEGEKLNETKGKESFLTENKKKIFAAAVAALVFIILGINHLKDKKTQLTPKPQARICTNNNNKILNNITNNIDNTSSNQQPKQQELLLLLLLQKEKWNQIVRKFKVKNLDGFLKETLLNQFYESIITITDLEKLAKNLQKIQNGETLNELQNAILDFLRAKEGMNSDQDYIMVCYGNYNNCQDLIKFIEYNCRHCEIGFNCDKRKITVAIKNKDKRCNYKVFDVCSSKNKEKITNEKLKKISTFIKARIDLNDIFLKEFPSLEEDTNEVRKQKITIAKSGDKQALTRFQANILLPRKGSSDDYDYSIIGGKLEDVAENIKKFQNTLKNKTYITVPVFKAYNEILDVIANSGIDELKKFDFSLVFSVVDEFIIEDNEREDDEDASGINEQGLYEKLTTKKELDNKLYQDINLKDSGERDSGDLKNKSVLTEENEKTIKETANKIFTIVKKLNDTTYTDGGKLTEEFSKLHEE